MIAKIIDSDKREYYSAVFAVCENGWDTSVIVYDNEKRRFAFIRMYRYTPNIERSVFITDCDENDFVKGKSIRIGFCRTIKHISGYDWLVENSGLFIDILKNKQVAACYKEKAESINKKISIDEWMIVKNDDDVKNLMSAAWGFHDGIIDKITFNNKSDVVEIIFSGCWGCKVTLRFQYDVEIGFSNCYKELIFSSGVFFENGFVYWVDDSEIKNEAKLVDDKNRNYFKARTLSWKQETEYNASYKEKG